ncbi:MAG: translation initiation factor eIF-2B [bacterium]|nr:translation initiation factor eIF-2B [bacterium]
MTNRDQQILDGLFRDLVDVYTPSECSLIALNGFMQALRGLRSSADRIEKDVSDLIQAVIDSQPRLYPLDNLLADLRDEIEKEECFKLEPLEKVVSSICELTEAQIDHLKASTNLLLEKGVAYIEDGDRIIVHSTHGVVLRILPMAKQLGREFEVLVLRQDKLKTRQIVKAMEEAGLPYTVCPEYDLTFCIQQANKFFIGAQAITSDNKAVCDAGTASIVGAAHLAELPTLLFASTLKLTPRDSSDQNIHVKSEIVEQNGTSYRQLTHSHDIVDLDLIDHLVTEQGEISPDQFPGLRRREL